MNLEPTPLGTKRAAPEVEAVAVTNSPVVIEVEAAVTSTPPVEAVVAPSSKDISTLVFFDLETTGLPFGPGAPEVQITELAMIAVGMDDFEQSQFPDLHDVRIINKILVCVRPTVAVSSRAAEITGLNDWNLQGYQNFDKDTALMIQIFISKLPKPVCLLAHNGNRFDFPLLKAEMDRVGVHLQADLLTCDTLLAFRSIGRTISTDDDESSPNKKLKGGSRPVKQSYKLQKLYEKHFDKEANGSHSAESDCVTLMMVCHKMKTNILPWICQNTRDFISCKSMWK